VRLSRRGTLIENCPTVVLSDASSATPGHWAPGMANVSREREKKSVLDGEGISDRARRHEHQIEGEQKLQPGPGFGDGTAAQKLGGGLRCTDHNWKKKRQGQHRQQQFGEACIRSHRAEQCPDRDETDRGQERDRDQGRGDVANWEVVEKHERWNGNQLNRSDENQIRDRLPKEDCLATHRRSEESIDSVIRALDSEGAVQSKESGKSENDPENSGSEIRHGDGGRIPGEVENDEPEQREHDRRKERASRAELDRQILARDEPGGQQGVSHSRRPPRDTSQRRTRDRFRPWRRSVRTFHAASPRRASPVKAPRSDCG